MQQKNHTITRLRARRALQLAALGRSLFGFAVAQSLRHELMEGRFSGQPPAAAR